MYVFPYWVKLREQRVILVPGWRGCQEQLHTWRWEWEAALPSYGIRLGSKRGQPEPGPGYITSMNSSEVKTSTTQNPALDLTASQCGHLLGSKCSKRELVGHSSQAVRSGRADRTSHAGTEGVEKGRLGPRSIWKESLPGVESWVVTWRTEDRFDLSC